MFINSKKYFTYIILLASMFIGTTGCSTKQNTWLSRNYQALNTRFNVYFNGNTSYQDGMDNIRKANKDDYSTILLMYPVSRHANAKGATGDMDKTIEKCRKAIKLHSIKVKPPKNYNKANDPKYKLFYNQEEYNPALWEAWLLLGKAEFHKGDFLGSLGTFSYIAKHYGTDKNIVAVCKLWMVRAYAEMGWIYEAEETLSKLNQDDLKYSNIGLFASVNADLLLKKRQYKEAIPFLELALSKEHDVYLKQRFTFLLAQLYQKMGDAKSAFETYSKVLKMNPSYEMDFNARISRAQLNSGDVNKVRKELRSMLRNSNNKEYRDQLFYALGNTYLQHGDTAQAIVNYKLSADTSSRKGIEKAVTLITLGDLYYKKRNYVLAQPCYSEASKIITNENDDFERVSRRAETLSELVSQNEIVQLQDSLQRLAAMPEAQRLEVVKNVIARVTIEEKRNADKLLKENEARARGAEMNQDDPGMQMPIGMTSQGGWYFYNPEIIRTGIVDFSKKWGRRKLEDNWRRSSKASSVSSEGSSATQAADGIEGTSTSTDSDAKGKKTDVGLADNKKPEFYLRQIPLTPDQIAKSNEDMAKAMFSMGEIYKEKIVDYPMAIKTFQDFISRFGTDKRVPDAYFNLYLIQNQLGNQTEAEKYRTKLLTGYPDTKYYQFLSQPDYFQRLEQMAKAQDSIYAITYNAYNRSDFETVFRQVADVQKNYPLSTLMPKFMFLKALSIGKKDSQENFRTALNNLVAAYPTSDVSAMAKDILSLMKQGKEAKNGTTAGTLLERRDETEKAEKTEEIKKLAFSTDKHSRYRLLLVSKASLENMNKLQYQMAIFNFSRFMIKDFDLLINKLDTVQTALSVTNFDSYDEVAWYLNSLNSDSTLTHLFSDMKVRKVIISDENFGLLKGHFTLNDYLNFEPKLLAAKDEAPKQIKKQEVVATKATLAKLEVKQEKVAPLEVAGIKQPTKVTEVVQTKQETKTTEKQSEKTSQKAVQDTIKNTQTVKTAQVSTQAKKNEATVKTAPQQTTTVQTPPKVEDVPLFKGLFAYRANEPHYIAIYVMNGAVEFEKIKTAYDAYNKQNYGMLNLKLSLEKVDKLQIIIIGSFADASIAKSYLLRTVREKSLTETLKGLNYRNLIGSQKNLDVMVQKNALDTYFDFMQEYYLK